VASALQVQIISSISASKQLLSCVSAKISRIPAIPRNLNDLIGYGLVFLLAAVGFACYEAAVKILFQTMDFAFIEASAELDGSGE
jgi:hypothetical protein